MANRPLDLLRNLKLTVLVTHGSDDPNLKLIRTGRGRPLMVKLVADRRIKAC
jgi:hypothetical protein